MITLDTHQVGAVKFLTRKRKALVKAPAGSGKTIIAAHALRDVLVAVPRSSKVRIGWLCHTVEQMSQARKAMDHFEEIERLADVQICCGAMGADWSDFDVLVCDECHLATSPSWRVQIKSCKGALWGFTATPKTGDDERDADLISLFGGNLYEIKREEIASRLVRGVVRMLDASDDNGHLIDDKIAKLERMYRRLATFPENKIKQMAVWQAIQQIGIELNEKRTAAGIDAAISHRADHVIVLVNKKDHGLAIERELTGSVLVTSGTPKARRREIMRQFGDGDIWCIIATSLADEGLDLPIANVMVLFSGGKSLVKCEQRPGRVMRSYPGKTQGIVYDFEDNNHRAMRNHSVERQRIYAGLGYSIERSDQLQIENEFVT